MMIKKHGGRSPEGVGGKGKRAGAQREGGFDRGERKSSGPRKAYGERKSYGDKPERKAYGERKEFGARKPYGERSERKPYGDKPERKAYGERKSYDDKPERKAYGERKEFGARKPYGERSERKSYGDKPERKAYGERKEFGARKPYGDKPERKAYGERKSFGERKAFGPKENRGSGPEAKFSGKRSIKRDRNPQEAGAGDGWLVGYHAVLSAMNAGRRKVRTVWLLAEAKGELADVLAKHPEWPVEIKAKPDFEQEFGEMVHQGVAALVGNLPQPSVQEVLATKPKLIVALDQVTDPHNLGAIVRSCAAFGAAAVLVTENRAVGITPTAAKAAAGAMETVPVVEIVNLAQTLEMLKDNGFRVAGLAGEAEQDIADYAPDGRMCLVVGSEGDGLRRLTREHCDVLLKIAIAPVIESLNVSVATGVALSTLASRLK